MKKSILILLTLLLVVLAFNSCKNERQTNGTQTETVSETSPGNAVGTATLDEQKASADNLNLPGKAELRQQIEQLQNSVSSRMNELQTNQTSVEKLEVEKQLKKLEGVDLELTAVLRAVNEADAEQWPKHQQNISKTLAKIRILIKE